MSNTRAQAATIPEYLIYEMDEGEPITTTEKFMIAERSRRWETGNWTEDLELRDGISINIQALMDAFNP